MNQVARLHTTTVKPVRELCRLHCSQPLIPQRYFIIANTHLKKNKQTEGYTKEAQVFVGIITIPT